MSDVSGEADDESAEEDDGGFEGSDYWEPVGHPNLLGYGPDYDPSPLREKTRSWLALALVALLAAIALSLIVLSALHDLSPETTKDLVEGILSPLIAVTGTALGFYFGGHHSSK